MALNKQNQEAASLREQRKQERKQERENARLSGKKRIRIRLIPIWLRVILVLMLVVGSAALGGIVGYSLMGDGQAKDVFKVKTWTHIVDYINSDS